jgi:hypothetical protein
MQLEPVKKFKEVGKKKIIAGATAGFLLIGGGATFASESGQSAVKGAIDAAIGKAVAYYVKNIDDNLSKYAEQERGNIGGQVAGIIDQYAKALQDHYNKELARGKASITNNQNAQIQENSNYAGQKYLDAKQKITDATNNQINDAAQKSEAEVAKQIQEQAGSIQAPGQ